MAVSDAWQEAFRRSAAEFIGDFVAGLKETILGCGNVVDLRRRFPSLAGSRRGD